MGPDISDSVYEVTSMQNNTKTANPVQTLPSKRIRSELSHLGCFKLHLKVKPDPLFCDTATPHSRPRAWSNFLSCPEARICAVSLPPPMHFPAHALAVVRHALVVNVALTPPLEQRKAPILTVTLSSACSGEIMRTAALNLGLEHRFFLSGRVEDKGGGEFSVAAIPPVQMRACQAKRASRKL